VEYAKGGRKEMSGPQTSFTIALILVSVAIIGLFLSWKLFVIAGLASLILVLGAIAEAIEKK
jgi:hypothetical protein